jgi:hypothetical protein
MTTFSVSLSFAKISPDGSKDPRREFQEEWFKRTRVM